MRNVIKNIFIGTLLFGFIACSDDYFDVNTPSASVNVDDLGMSDLLGPVIHSTLYTQYYAETVAGNYTQYFGGYGYAAAGFSEMSSAWSEIYLYILPNTEAIKEKAEDSGAIHYGAIAEILEAINISLAADMWDNIPYTEATDGTENPYPDFDTQEQVYASAITLLDSAISSLQSEDNSNISVGNEDLIYGGDIDQWLKAAFTIKARLQLHLMAKGIYSATDVLGTIENGFTSVDDDFQMDFPSEELNPWYSNNVLTRNTGNYYRAPNDQIVSLMNGTSYPFESGLVDIDPRLPIMFQNDGAEGDPWRGFVNGGEGESSDGEDANTFFKDGGYYTNATSPLALITYAEAMFIKAEAAFLANGGNETSVGANITAYEAYMEGITASMEKLSADGSDYMADSAVDVGVNNLMLNHIMKEKYIANYLNVETYNDFRRYNFSSDVFKDLALRLEGEGDDSEYTGLWYRRAVYPDSEQNSNEDVVNANWQEPTVDVWWAE